MLIIPPIIFPIMVPKVWVPRLPEGETVGKRPVLERELAHRFDVACCATQEQFRREARAITRAGQIKMPGERH